MSIFFDNQKYLDHILSNLGARLPRLADGRIDYTHSKFVPVVSCFIFCAGDLLMLQKGTQADADTGVWGVVDGYIDSDKVVPLEKGYAEMKSQLDLDPWDFENQLELPIFRSRSEEVEHLVVPLAFVVTDRFEPSLSDQHSEYRWASPVNVRNVQPQADYFGTLLSRVLDACEDWF